MKNNPENTKLILSISIALCVLTNEAAAQTSSPATMAVKASTLIKQMSEAKNQGTCISSTYRSSMLSIAKSWFDEANSLPAQELKNLSPLYKKLKNFNAIIKNTPDCVPPSPSKTIDKSKLKKNDPKLQTILGNDAGHKSMSSDNSLFIGVSAGREAIASDHSVIVGDSTGYALKSSPFAVLLGSAAGQFLENAPSAVALGSSAGRQAKQADHTVFLGSSAGYGATKIGYSIFLGYAAGRWIYDNEYSIIAGYAAGEYADGASYSVLAGNFAGYRAKSSAQSIMIGREAGMYANNATSSIMLGTNAGQSAEQALSSIFIGENAGTLAAKAKNVILIGTSADAEPGIENAIGIGKNAHPTQSNTWHIPDTLQIGIGTSAPTAQLHTTKKVRFESLANGVLITDKQGNVSASTLLNDALKEIAELKARVKALEAKKCS